jgi:hypothetical protein
MAAKMREYLESQVAARRLRLAALDTQRITVAAELATLEDALAQATDHSIPSTNSPVATVDRSSLSVGTAWLTILERMAEFTHFNASDVGLAASQLYKDEKLKKPLTKDGIRAQLSILTRKRILKRRGGGNYLLTEETRLALGLKSKKSLGRSS